MHHVLIRRFWSDSKVLQLPVALERATHTTPCQFSEFLGSGISSLHIAAWKFLHVSSVRVKYPFHVLLAVRNHAKNARMWPVLPHAVSYRGLHQ